MGGALRRGDAPADAVELEHRELARHGEHWDGLREGVAGDEGWPLYLRQYADRLAEER